MHIFIYIKDEVVTHGLLVCYIELIVLKIIFSKLQLANKMSNYWFRANERQFLQTELRIAQYLQIAEKGKNTRKIVCINSQLFLVATILISL